MPESIGTILAEKYQQQQNI